jgi:hypothetical protein
MRSIPLFCYAGRRLAQTIRGPAKSTAVKLKAGAFFTLNSGSGGACGILPLKRPIGHTLVGYLPSEAGIQYLDLVSASVSFTSLWRTSSWACFKMRAAIE